MTLTPDTDTDTSLADSARAAFADIDSFEVERFLRHLDDNVVFTFGNAPSAHGKEQVRQAVLGFWETIAGLTHHVQNVWEVGGGVTVADIQVEYTRHDGGHVTVPNVDILTWKDGVVIDWRIVIDVAPVYA
jgi:ketosteroid isomerase-like protein